jgi:hypothetical protein
MAYCQGNITFAKWDAYFILNGNCPWASVKAQDLLDLILC